MAEANLTAARARELLSYDQDTGALSWRVSVGTRARPGCKAGWVMSLGYVQVKIDGGVYYAHRVIWLMQTGEWPANHVDHKNGVRKDNRWCNLRDVTCSVNSQNQRHARADSKTGMFGVTVSKRRFRARIKLNGERFDLGSFPTQEAAHEAYLAAKRTLHEGCTI